MNQRGRGEGARVSTIFPKWMNHLPTIGALGALGALTTVVGGVWYYFTPKFWEAGYMPAQPRLEASYIEDLQAANPPLPVPGVDFPGFSHQIHAGKLALDCRYCHTNVETSTEANIPAVATCIGCHAEGHVNDQIYAKAERVKFIRDAYAGDESIHWRRVHKLPDYVRNFPHNVHVHAGVSCFSCHGNIMEQPTVHQVQPISMGWCLDCHRNPAPNLVPPEHVTDLYFVRKQLEDKDKQAIDGPKLLDALKAKNLHIAPENCGACHF